MCLVTVLSAAVSDGNVCRVMQWGAPYSIGFLHVSWKPVGFKSMLIAKACHMSPDCDDDAKEDSNVHS